MKDSEFSELELRATIVPQQVRWPNNVLHWEKLNGVVEEARNRLAQACALMDAIDKDPDLSPGGKHRQKRNLALEAIADFEKANTLAATKEAVDKQLAKWTEKTGLAVKAPTNVAEAVIQSEIRAHLASMKEGKLDFLMRHARDPLVASSILCAPGFLSGLTDTQVSVVKQRLDQHVTPEIAAARDATVKALEEAEQGWQKAIDKIGERGGLNTSS